ncbi:MAG: hypothetical protein GY811_00350 [Myxococcales bacterium]|nr:hypothetical protein [Myxococcales bacterium]
MRTRPQTRDPPKFSLVLGSASRPPNDLRASTSILFAVFLFTACGGGGGDGASDASNLVADADPNSPDADPSAPDAREWGTKRKPRE